MEKSNRKAYLLCDKEDITPDFGRCIEVTDSYCLWVDDTTIDLSDNTDGDRRIIVMGLFTDCRNPDRDNDMICRGLLEAWKNGQDALLEECSYIAGHYAVITTENGKLCMIPDACCTYGIAYIKVNGKTAVSSNPKLLADLLGLSEDPAAVHMRRSTNQGEALPNDRTMYKEIRMLLPNHILDLTTATTSRFFPGACEPADLDRICKVSAEYLHNITAGLLKRKSLTLPLTGGIDSRTILAAVGKENAKQIQYYTYRHKRFSDETGDLVIPAKIAADYGLDYQQIPDLAAPEAFLSIYRDEIENDPEIFTPGLCYTYQNSELNGKYFLSGGIAPVGKSVYGNLLPERLCTASYLLVKAHNSSREAYRELKKWLKGIKPYCCQSGISAYDMFYWEYRCGRWDQRTHLLIDATIDMVSPYNCGKLLQLWVTVPRKYRQQKLIHTRIIENCWPELMQYPLNPDSGFTSAIKKHRYLYWLSSYAFWIKESVTRKLKK